MNPAKNIKKGQKEKAINGQQNPAPTVLPVMLLLLKIWR